MLIREMTPEDYDAVYALWQATEGLGLSDADSREAAPSRGGALPARGRS